MIEGLCSLGDRNVRLGSAGNSTGGARGRFGIRFKLVVVVTAIAAMTSLSGLLTWGSYSEVERLLAAVTRGNLPAVSSALKLSEATARLAAAAPGLDGSVSEAQRRSNFLALHQQAERLRGLIDHLGGGADAGHLDELRGLMAAIADNIAGRNLLVERRLHLANRMRLLAAQAEALETAIRDQLGKRAGDPTVAAMARAVDLIRGVPGSLDHDALAERRHEFDAGVRTMAVLVEAGGPADSAHDLARRVLALGNGADNAFELRSQQLLTEARLTEIGRASCRERV